MNKPNIHRNLQKFKQLTAVMGLLLATTLLVSCSENSATNLREKNNIGIFQGYEVEFIRDRHIDSRALGLYVFRKMNDNNRPDSADLRDSGVVGTFEGREIHFIRDRNSDSRGVGFYAVNHDGKLEPINSSFAQPNGKSVSAISSIVLTNDNIIRQYDLNKMSVKELDELTKVIESSIKYKNKNSDINAEKERAIENINQEYRKKLENNIHLRPKF